MSARETTGWGWIQAKTICLAIWLAIALIVCAAWSASAPVAFADTGGSLSTGKVSSTSSSNSSTKLVTVHRMYNQISGEHLYTTDTNERDVLMNRYHWTYEGVAFKTPEKSSTKVYRVYNRHSGEHHYTSDAHEVSVLTSRYGWTNEGLAWYSDDSERIPVHRLYNPKATFAHHYTTDTNERDVLRKSYGWRYEGVAWYAAEKGYYVETQGTEHLKWLTLLNSCPATNTTWTNKSITAAQRNTLDRLASKGDAGFIALNIKTGKMVCRNCDGVYYSASTMKAIYIASLCKYGAPGIGSWSSSLYSIITYSNNELYNQLCAYYGKGYLNRIADVAGVKLKGGLAGCYAYVSPRDLAKLWSIATQYIRSNEYNSALYRNSFGKGAYYKEGWMYNGMLGGQLYNIVGFDGDVIYAVMSRYIYQSPDLWTLRNTLIAATR